MAERPTVADVARLAGVSVATVDRVLNRRRPVRPETAEAVVQAAEALKYYATALMRQRAAGLGPRLSLGFVLQKQSKLFYQALASALQEATQAASEVRATARIVFVEALSPAALVAAMRDLGQSVDAMAAVAIDHPHIADEIARLRGDGVPTLSLLSPLSAAAATGHVGVDARKAGRTAGWAMARCLRRTGPVGVLIGSHRYLGHEDRETGFRSYFRQHSPGTEILDSLAYLDDDAGAHGTMLELLSRQPGLAGLYVIGGGIEGALSALREEQVSKDLALVCQGLDGSTRNALLDGTVDLVIDTPVEAVARRAVEALVAAATAPGTAIGRIDVPFEIHVSETI